MREPPTLQEIRDNHYDLSISCETCRRLNVPNLDSIIAKRPLDTPIDQLTFRCSRCGEVGRAIVRKPGNMLLGHPIVWPPEGQ